MPTRAAPDSSLQAGKPPHTDLTPCQFFKFTPRPPTNAVGHTARHGARNRLRGPADQSTRVVSGVTKQKVHGDAPRACQQAQCCQVPQNSGSGRGSKADKLTGALPVTRIGSDKEEPVIHRSGLNRAHMIQRLYYKPL